MSPANEKRSPKRRSLAAIAVVVAAGMVSAILFAMPAHATESEEVVQTEVCFTVHVIGDPLAYQVSGTLFHDGKTSPPGTRTALLLQHGSVATRSSWDGERPHVTGVRSMARPLAAAGYDVFAVDRLGYGRSPYVHKETGIRGSGWALTMDSYVAMTSEMVTQIRAGTFRVGGTDSCVGGNTAMRPAPKGVVLMGVSGGAGLAQYYATKHRTENLAKIDGIVSLMWSSHGSSDRFTEYFLRETTQQYAEGKDYVYLVKATEPGYSKTCEDFLFYKPGVSSHALAQLCGPEGFGSSPPKLSPSGDLSSQVAMQHEIKHLVGLGRVGPTPALLVFARQDAVFTTADFGEPDTITPDIENWQKNCNCPVTVLWQENSGHVGHFHRSSAQVVDGILAWLRGRGL